MKPYFAKYLPVEGEIQVRDTYIDPKHTYTGILIRTLGTDDKSYESCKKVKLFLCNRDVQPGDEIWVEPDAINCYLKNIRFRLKEIIDHIYEDVPNKIYKIPMIEYISHPGLPHLIGTSREWIMNNLWKPVGEISSDAKWVKEGDEFDEEDINKQHYDDSGVDNPWIDCLIDDWEELPDKFKRIQLKGPCGHFH